MFQKLSSNVYLYFINSFNYLLTFHIKTPEISCRSRKIIKSMRWIRLSNYIPEIKFLSSDTELMNLSKISAEKVPCLRQMLVILISTRQAYIETNPKLEMPLKNLKYKEKNYTLLARSLLHSKATKKPDKLASQ